jgi:hypothetical protein
MKTIRFFRLLVLRVVVLTICVMAWSYLTELIETTKFFGDTYIKKFSWDTELYHEWGWRHYVWNTMGIVLVGVSIVRIVVWGDWYWKQVEKDDNVNLKSAENKLF